MSWESWDVMKCMGLDPGLAQAPFRYYPLGARALVASFAVVFSAQISTHLARLLPMQKVGDRRDETPNHYFEHPPQSLYVSLATT